MGEGSQPLFVPWGMTGVLEEHGLGIEWVTGYESKNRAGGVIEKRVEEVQKGAEAQTFGVVRGLDEAQSVV